MDSDNLEVGTTCRVMRSGNSLGVYVTSLCKILNVDEGDLVEITMKKVSKD